MSFIRTGRPSAPGRRKRAGGRKKPAWDDTLQDLTVHKASPEEQAYRKAMHTSKHGLKTKLEKQEKNHRKARSPKPTARQVAVMKEILYDQQQLHDVLSKSDQMMSVVQDLFGDDPRRFAGFPNVTAAPGQVDPNKTSRLVAPLPDVHTQLEALSQSIMNGSALNDSSDEYEGHSDDAPDPIVYQPRLNLDRFHQFLAAEEQNGTLSTISGAGQETGEPGPAHSTKLPDMTAASNSAADGSLFQTPPRGKKPSMARTPRSAANDTGKIKRSKQRVSTAGETSHSSSALNLNELRKVLTGLETEIAEFEHQTGRQQLTDCNHSDSFSGYTLTLVGAVTKLTRYLKETELRLRAETTVREQLSQDVVQLRSLVDALTSDIIYTQEEYGKVLGAFDRYKKETQREIFEIKQALQTDAHRREPILPSTSIPEQVYQERERFTTPPKQIPQTQAEMSEGLPCPVPSIPVSLIHQGEPLQPAVLLSPPVQRNRIPQRENATVVGKQTSLLDLVDVKSPAVPVSTAVTSEGGIDFSAVLSRPTAIVTVPRPVPLVQTNVRVPLSHNLPPPSHSPGDAVSSWHGSSLTSLHQVSEYPQRYETQPPQRSQNTVTFQQPSAVQHSVQPSAVQHSVQPSAVQNSDMHTGKERADNPEKSVLASQIAELNRQHEEAQRRLQTLIQQQQPRQPPLTQISQKQVDRSLPRPQVSLQQFQAPKSHQQGQSSLPRPVFSRPGATHKKLGPAEGQISPDVSPISERSSSVRVSLPADHLYSKGQVAQSDYPGRYPQGITVSIPTMQLDLSQFSEPSPNQHMDLMTQLAEEACQ